MVHQKVTNPTKEYKLEAFIDEAGPNNNNERISKLEVKKNGGRMRLKMV